DKRIVLGTILTVFLMLMIPNIHAVEYNEVKGTVESRVNILKEQYEKIGIESFNLIDALRYLLQTFGLGIITIYSLFMLIYTLKFNNTGMTFLWLFDVIVGAYVTVQTFQLFLTELKNPT
ncbi:MAG: hypothetical protein SW127_20300, partial [Actinomycetota bacterium]|nr:hypothetical protein [Actinomycetota bacterium]